MPTLTLQPPANRAAEDSVPERASTGRLQWWAMASALAVLLAAWLALLLILDGARRDALDAEVRQNTNLARALEEQTVRVLAAVDQATLRARDAAATLPTGSDRPLPNLVRFANETGLAPAILVQLSLIGADGRFIASNLDPDGHKTGNVDLSAREHVRVHLAPQTLAAEERLKRPDDLFIGKPVLGKVSHRWTIQLSRRIVGPDGALLGVVVASLDPAYFEGVYQRVLLGQRGGVALAGLDRGIRARVIGGKAEGMGSIFPANSLFSRHVAGMEGRYRGPSSIDGIDRVYAYRRVADYPLVLLVSVSSDEALADWHVNRNVMVGLTLLLSAVVVGGTAAFVLSLRRLDSTHQALRDSEARAQAASQAKSDFLAAISHELRTPLTSIRGFAELMERRLEQPRFREQAGLIRKGAEYLNELLTQILDLVKLEAGAMQLRTEPTDLRALAQGTADYFSLPASDKGLALTLEGGEALPPVNCDPLRTKQILNNLLSNAVKFTEAGSIHVSIAQVDGRVQVQVRDTGPGIAPELHDTIFERFRQGDGRVSYQHGGTGLGLALSRALAELMHGSLTVASQPGQGACFTLSLPA